MRGIGAAAIAGLVLVSAPAWADDSSAALGAGGLVLTQATDIRMAREDLFIAPHKVKIRFEFVNDSASDIETIVAFPLPDIDQERFWHEPIGTVTEDPVNFVGFSVVADGVRVKPEVEQRAFYKGKDVTDTVLKAGAPINILTQAQFKAMQALKPAQAKILEDAGLADHEDGGDGDSPHWTARTKFFWKQKFPAGKTVVLEHSYQPVTGQAFFIADYVKAKPSEDAAFYFKTYCIDSGTKASIAARFGAKGGGNPDESKLLISFTTDYVLTSGNNWKGPIGHFHLTLDKEKADNIISLCWDGALKKTGATTFESTLDNFAPKQDIKMLVLTKSPPQ